MKKSFRDPVTNVLKAHGFMESNAPGDLAREEPDDFKLEPGKWRFDGEVWVEHADPRIALRAEIEALNGPLPDQKLKGQRELNMVVIEYALAPGEAERKSAELGRPVTVEEVLADERTYQVLLADKLRARELEQQLEALGG